MTLEAVRAIIGRGVLSDEFRERLTSGNMTREQIAAAQAGLDEEDVTAIRLATLMNVGNFPGFSSEMGLYFNHRYGSGRAGDDQPISV